MLRGRLEVMLLAAIALGCALGCARGGGQPEGERDATVDAPRDAAGSDGARPSASACSACSTAMDCSSSEQCVPLGAGGRACLPVCEAGDACPDGFECTSRDGEGAPVCTPPERSCCVDRDGDGHGIGMDCESIDCDDGAPEVHPDAAEGCNEIDDDCDGTIDEPSDELCDDGIDQDCDGLVDCADTEACGDGVACGSGRTCMAGACGCSGSAIESACGDGVDDDCDGLIDCADGDCGGLSCDASGRTCVGGECSCAAGGGPELCNGVDDDCDGSIDSGCPTSIGLCCAAQGPSYGTDSAPGFLIECPAGHAMIGLDGRASDSRYLVAQPVCAALSLGREVATPEDRIVLRTGTTIIAAATSGSGGTPFSDRCGSNEVVIAIEGRTGDEVDRMAFVCGRVRVERGSGGAWEIVITQTTTSPGRGGGGGDPVSYRCPAGSVATGIHGRSNDRLRSFGIICSELRLN